MPLDPLRILRQRITLSTTAICVPLQEVWLISTMWRQMGRIGFPAWNQLCNGDIVSSFNLIFNEIIGISTSYINQLFSKVTVGFHMLFTIGQFLFSLQKNTITTGINIFLVYASSRRYHHHEDHADLMCNYVTLRLNFVPHLLLGQLYPPAFVFQ